jgi:micrococcal nuclease
MLLRPGALLLAGFAIASAANGADLLVGPIRADVIRVIDGDTLAVRADIWIGQSVATSVRIRGIDAPEMRGRCAEEKALAAAARDLLAEIAGPVVAIGNVENDKYGGRVVADIRSGTGVDLARAMIERGYAQEYSGRGPRPDWCFTASLGQ